MLEVPRIDLCFVGDAARGSAQRPGFFQDLGFGVWVLWFRVYRIQGL